jgi:hypothetical protein
LCLVRNASLYLLGLFSSYVLAVLRYWQRGFNLESSRLVMGPLSLLPLMGVHRNRLLGTLTNKETNTA